MGIRPIHSLLFRSVSVRGGQLARLHPYPRISIVCLAIRHETDSNTSESNLGTTGAAITALSLGIGVFTQQALHTTPCLKRLTNENASMPVAQTSLTALVPLGDDTASSRLAMELQTAFFSGLFAPQSDSRLSPVCNSGNCTFPENKENGYSTVGFSSACVDMSPMLLQTGPASWDPGDISLDLGNPAAVKESSVNYSVSSELSLTYHLWPRY